MPTENLYSNTEQMFSVPRSLLEEACNGLRITQDRARKELRDLLAQPPAQYQGEPAWYMIENGLSAVHAKDKAKSERQGFDMRAYCVPLYRHPPTSADAGELERLRAALKFYADREHYHFESGNWDTVSGEPLNILWCGDDPDFIEDGSVARAALSTSADPSNDLCAEGAHEFVPFRSKCVKCDEPYSAEPSAREAHILKDESRLGIERLPAEPSAPNELEGVEDLARRIAARVKARAALERKP
ncbi:hypothetical protein [Pseudomonas sp. S12(2018)]|uniref:hypothetical protein n=1 Tax=Pseudomonas sp. S12(2018) TaxID=2219664 RepID=UPI001E40FCF1|nr:hypothetical protein [Pseudomonas sp. S12(2018)]